MNPLILIGAIIAALFFFRKKGVAEANSGNSSVQTGGGNSSGSGSGTTGGTTDNTTGASGGGEVSTLWEIGEAIHTVPNYGLVLVSIPVRVKNTGSSSIYVEKGELNSTPRYIYDPTVENRLMTQIKPYTTTVFVGKDVAPGETLDIGTLNFELRGTTYLFSSVIGKNIGTVYFAGTGLFRVSGQIKNLEFATMFRI